MYRGRGTHSALFCVLVTIKRRVRAARAKPSCLLVWGWVAKQMRWVSVAAPWWLSDLELTLLTTSQNYLFTEVWRERSDRKIGGPDERKRLGKLMIRISRYITLWIGIHSTTVVGHWSRYRCINTGCIMHGGNISIWIAKPDPDRYSEYGPCFHFSL